PARAERQAARKKVIANLADTITNTQTVKTFAKESFEMDRNEVLEDDLLRHRILSWQLVAADGNNRIAVVLAFEVVFVWLMIHLVQRDPAILAIGIFAFTYTITLTNRLFEINTMVRSIEDSLLDASPMTEILQETPEILDQPDAPSLRVKKGQIDFKQVDFQYDKDAGQDAVFERLDLSIKPGEKVGLVGPSGGGKSTFTRLLLRFEDIQSGEISIDEQDISKVTQASLREAISYVPQEPLLFHRTISQNIAYGLPHASADAIAKAAKKAYALDFITALPQGFDTIVGERGVKLSGGQRQRIAIARAILKHASI
ncbi:MAG: ABC transporter ATP-binding protein, partial [Candidatus Saccharimonadales bacterium]